MSASCTQCVAILYNTVGGESFSERTSGPFSKDALHAQVWHKNAVITGSAFVANDDRPARDVHLDTSINGQNHVLALRIAYKNWLVSAWRCYLSDASTNEFFYDQQLPWLRIGGYYGRHPSDSAVDNFRCHSATGDPPNTI
jgi:hypothetical protein